MGNIQDLDHSLEDSKSMNKSSSLVKACEYDFQNEAINILNSDEKLTQENLDLALYNSCKFGNVYLASQLIQHGAKKLNDCLTIAIKNKNIEIIKLLINKVDINSKDSNEYTPLYYCEHFFQLRIFN